MTIPVEQFPILTPAQQGGFGGAIAGLQQAFQQHQQDVRNALQNQMLQQQTQGIGLQNQSRQATLPFQAPLAQAQLTRQQALAANPLLNMPGAAGQIGAMLYAQGKAPQSQQPSQPTEAWHAPMELPKQASAQPQSSQQSNDPNAIAGLIGGQSSPADIIKQSLLSSINKNKALGDYYQKRSNSYAYSTAPINYKNYITAQLAGAGIDPDQGINEMVNQGATLDDILQQHGFDKNTRPAPDYFATGTNQTQLVQRQARLAEVNNLENVMKNAMAPYAQTVAGFSPSQIKDALSGSDPDKQAQFLAARALQPELAIIRANMAQGSVGQDAIKALVDKGLGNVKVYQAQVTPKVYSKMQDYMNQWLTGAVNSANAKVLHTNIGINSNNQTQSIGGLGAQNQATTQSTSNLSPNQVMMYDKNGIGYPIDKSQVQIAAQRGLSYGTK